MDKQGEEMKLEDLVIAYKGEFDLKQELRDLPEFKLVKGYGTRAPDIGKTLQGKK